MPKRSDCPISFALDHMGDKWSLLILRDLLFFNKSSYSELKNSDEGMATNILSSRLEKLELDGLISKTVDEHDKRKKVYKLKSSGKATLPIILEMMIWSVEHDNNLAVPAKLIERAKTDRENLIKDILDNIKD